jgi:hypothetical protein
MQPKGLAGFCLALSLAALSGCAGPPPPQVVVAPAPAASPSPAASAPVALLRPPEESARVPTVRHHVVAVVHPVIHRHWTHRPYVVRTYYPPPNSPQCGSDVHPCSVEHIVVPID